MSRVNTIHSILLRLVICEPTTLETGCWEWPGSRCKGHYGVCSMARKNVMIHRVVYEHFVGPIPEGLEIDHACHNRVCANFEHTSPATPDANKRRQRPYTPSPRREYVNRRSCPHGFRRIVDCKECTRVTLDRGYLAQKERRKAIPPPTICRNGHDLTGENLVLAKTKHGTKRTCRICCSNAGKKGGKPSHKPHPS